MNPEQTKQTWNFVGSLAIALLLLTLVLYQHTVLYLVKLWNQLDIGEYAHGYLVLAISGYLILTKRQVLFSLAPHPEYRASLGIITASTLWMLATLIDVQMLQTVGLLLLILALVWTVLGNQVIRAIAFPILFIGFAIPVWFPLSPLLQDLTADWVFWAIRFLDIPAFRQENMIVLPAGTLSVEAACSGLRYLLAALTLGTLYAYMNYSSLRARLTVVLISACAAILTNILRVFIVIYLGYVTEMQHPLVYDHLALGWYLFGGVVIILLFFDAHLYKRLPVPDSNTSSKPHKTTLATHPLSHAHYFVFVIVIGLVTSIAPIIIYQIDHQSLNEVETIPIKLPQQAENWLQTKAPNDNWMPVYHGAINHKQFYKRNDDQVIFYIGYYPVQKQGEEIINSLNQIGTKDKWRTHYPRSRLQNINDRQVLEQIIYNDEKQQRLVWYWYNISGKITTSKYEAKILQLFGMLTGKNWGFIAAASVEKNNDIELSRQILKDFILSIKDPVKNEIKKVSANYEK